jgi:hypothetical protein
VLVGSEEAILDWKVGMTTWYPTKDERGDYLGRECAELAQAICELRPLWVEVVRYPEKEDDPSVWEDARVSGLLPSHHVAARTPVGRALDIRGWHDDDAGWARAEEYSTRFELSRKHREVARRMLATLGA